MFDKKSTEKEQRKRATHDSERSEVEGKNEVTDQRKELS